MSTMNGFTMTVASPGSPPSSEAPPYPRREDDDDDDEYGEASNFRVKKGKKVNMDSLKVAADKLRKSPKVMRKKIDHALHRDSKIGEDWINNRENVNNGVTFNVKNLGKRLTKIAQGTGCTDAVVKELVEEAEKRKKSGDHSKLQKLSLTVNDKKLIIHDLMSAELVEEFAIHRVSYCTADPNYPKVFAFIAKQKGVKEMYAYALLTNRRAMAEAIALTVAQAFTMAFEDWQEKQKEEQRKVEDSQQADALELYGDLASPNKCPDDNNNPFKPNNPFRSEDDLLNGNSEFDFVQQSITDRVQEIEINEPSTSHASSDDEDEFLRFAVSRNTNPEVTFNTGLVRRDTFKGNVTDYLSVNNTLLDLDKSKSTEDLFSAANMPPSPVPVHRGLPTQRQSPVPSPLPSPIPSPTPSRRRNRDQRPTAVETEPPVNDQPLIQF